MNNRLGAWLPGGFTFAQHLPNEGGIAGMKLCKMHLVAVCWFFLMVVPAYAQRVNFGVDVGETSDKFGGLAAVTGLELDIDGQVTILKNNEKTGRPAIVAGGEIRLPSDTSNHAREYALFGGPAFPYHNFVFSLHAQIHQLDLPVAYVDNQYFARDRFRLLELPVVIRYNFASGKRAFVEAQGAPEFTPHYHNSPLNLAPLPNPNFDHGYFIRGSAGYNFKWWYVKATYETRYFRFLANPNNPNGLYNWRTNLATGGVGFVF